MRFNLSDWAVRNGALTLFLILLLGAAGGFAYLKLGRAEDPSFTIKTMVITAQWPGATAEAMQAQVADRIESKLQDLRYLDYVQTYVRPGQAVVQVLLRDTTPPAQVPEMWYQVRKKVGDMRHLLPAGVQGPFLDDEYSDVYAGVFAITGTADNAELVRQAEALRLRLLQLPNAGKVAIFGEQAQQVFVEVSHARLATIGIPPTTILDALARNNAVAPAGVVETPSSRVWLRTDAGFDGLAAIRAVPVEAGGRTLRLGDIATIRRGTQDPPGSAIRFGGEPAVLVAVAKRPGADVLALGEELRMTLEAVRANLPTGLAVAQIADQPQVVAESVGEFLLKFVAALGVVMLVSFLALGFRAGIVVALAVPLTLAMVFLAMLALGMELERITLGALILSLGLLVDDAIIAIEAMVVKLEEGWDRARAASFAWTSTAFPMLSGTLVTVAGFLPVGFAASTAGEYAGGIFWVIGIALIASWIVAVVFTPYLGVRLLPRPRPGHGGHAYDGRLYRGLRRIVGWCVDHRWPVLLATLGVMAAGFAGMAATKKQFFPTSARLELLVDITLRQGAGLRATQGAAEAVERALAGDPGARTVTTYLGAGSPRFFLALNPDLPNEAFAKVVINTADLAARERIRATLLALAADGSVPDARLRVSRLDFGPPVGFPVQFRVHGPDPAVLRGIADAALAALRATPGTRDAQLAWGERMPTLRVALDEERLAQLGLAPQGVAQALQTLVSGTTATQLREGNRLVDVVLRTPAEERLALAALGDIAIATPAGAVPLAQLARLEPAMEEPILWRRNREPYLTVRADVADGLQAPDVAAAAQPRMEAIRATLPPGYRIVTGGATEESGKANAALFSLFPVMVAAMLLLLMVQLRHFGRTALVIATAPLGIPGAAAALLLTGSPFGFVALLGVIALAGMIMRNTLILVDQVRQDLEAGAPLRTAIIESTVRRARPVVLTALAAVLAFVPLTLSVFWGPMAVAMIGGLTLATLATLLVVPALYGLALTRWRRAGSAAREAQPGVVLAAGE
ncbi:MAG: efflux RND transporter permease subunit [Acetobacteraceae bacterium]|nr:efflux RND transporter permease subunit [Acetobacteraceae bacterium]